MLSVLQEGKVAFKNVVNCAADEIGFVSEDQGCGDDEDKIANVDYHLDPCTIEELTLNVS